MKVNSEAQKCKGTTRNGIPCKCHPMKGCKYCYVHSIGRFKDIVWIKNPIVHLFIAILVSIILFMMGPSRRHQDEILVNQRSTQASINELLQRTEESLHERLLKDYPCGYSLFYSDGRRFTYQDYGSKVIKIDWSAVKIGFNETRIHVKLPNWKLLPNGGTFSENKYGLERIKGKTIGRDRFRIGTIVFPVIECVSTDKDSVVVAIGFDKKS